MEQEDADMVVALLVGAVFIFNLMVFGFIILGRMGCK